MSLRTAVSQHQGQTMAELLDEPGESCRGTWFEPIAEAYRTSNFALLVRATEVLLDHFKEASGGYLTPVIAKVIVRLARSARGDTEAMRKTKEILDGVFRYTRSGEPDKQAVALLVLSQLFKIFFALDTPGLGRNLVRTISQPGFPALTEFDLGDYVCFSYYSGRLSLLEDDPAAAQTSLLLAYSALPRRDFNRRRLVLEYLAPVRMTLGFRPNLGLLRELGLVALVEMGEAVAAGKGRALAAALDRHRKYLVGRGTYLAMCRLKLVASRQLLKLCVRALNNNNRVGLKHILPVFQKWDDFEPTEDGMEQLKCLLANLIFEGLVRGYISHEHGVLVLSAKEPFPKTSAALSRGYERE